jgi:hypothetical protein
VSRPAHIVFRFNYVTDISDTKKYKRARDINEMKDMGHSRSLNNNSSVSFKGVYKVTLQIKIKLQLIYISALELLGKKLRSQIGARSLGARNDNPLKGPKEVKVNLSVG